MFVGIGSTGDPAALARAAAEDERRAAEPLPPPNNPQRGYMLACDSLTCPRGLAWSAAAGGGGGGAAGGGATVAAPLVISACARCSESRYCSVACQTAAWPQHKLWCDKTRPPTRPLRLMQRVVRTDALAKLGIVSPIDAEAEPQVKFKSPEYEKAASATIAVDALLARLAPERIVIVVPHVWAHEMSGAGQTRCADATLFEIGEQGARGIDARALLQAASEVMPYIFREEDRLAAGVRYEPSTHLPVLGKPCPPRTASMYGARVDANSVVIDAGIMGRMGPGLVMMGMSRWRWPTMGPFECSEMCLEDIVHAGLSLLHPPEWPAKWYACVLHQSA